MLASSSRNALSISRRLASRSGGSSVEGVVSAPCLSRRPFSVSTGAQASQERRTVDDQHIVSSRRAPYRPKSARSPTSAWQLPTTSLTYLSDGNVDPVSQLTACNVELEKLADRHMSVAMLKVLAAMKREGVKPDLRTYNTLLSILGSHAMCTEALSVMDDMKALGIRPDIQTYNHIINASRFHDASWTYEHIQSLENEGLYPNATTYAMAIRKSVADSKLEMALRHLVEMEDKGLAPKLETAQSIIALAARMGQARLAIDLAENFEMSSVRRLENHVWVDCLIAATGLLYQEGVTRMWQKVVHDLKITPDEGVCLEALNTAARHGLPDLAMDVLETLRSIGAEMQEHHFAAIVEAYARTGGINEAFSILALMRQQNIVPGSGAAYPIFSAIQGSPADVDAAWDVLEEMHKKKEPVDITAINAIIQASVSQGDLQRAVGTYKSCSEFGVAPDVDTYNTLLSGCIAARHRELGDRLLLEMREANLKPDFHTYERLVILCLTSPTYEDAFFYLEEMKAEGHIPPYSVYEAIIRRCVSEGDARYKLAVEELREVGYLLSPQLVRFIESEGKRQQGEGGTPSESNATTS